VESEGKRRGKDGRRGGRMGGGREKHVSLTQKHPPPPFLILPTLSDLPPNALLICFCPSVLQDKSEMFYFLFI